MRTRTKALTAVAVSAALLLGTATAAVAGLLPSGDSYWSTAAAMRSSDDGLAVPTLVAGDSRDIHLRVAQFDKSGVQIRWDSKAGITRHDCHRGAISGANHAGAPWWPASTPSTGWTCGWWNVFERSGTFYAWHDTRTDKIT